MTGLLELKEFIRGIYAKYEIYITPVIKFILALVSLLMINGKLGYMSKLNSITMVLVCSLLCSFLPVNLTILLCAAFIVLHLYSLSLECAVVVLAIFLIMFLLYFRFSPRDGILVLLTPIFSMLNVPFLMPIVAGLTGTPASAVSVACGAIVYNVLVYISDSVNTLNSMDAENGIQKYRYVVDGILNNKSMFVMIAAFVLIVVLVYFVRRMGIDYAWTAAIASGVIAGALVMFVGDLILDIDISIVMTIVGALLSALFAKVFQFFVFNVDYSRTEYAQFEDDEYYYYVKAIPKITMARPEKTVKKITSQKRPSQAPHTVGNGTVRRSR